MLKVLILLSLCLPSFGAYDYVRTVTVDHTKVPTSNQTDFPVLIRGTYSYLATVANGGLINNTVTFNGQTVPADLKFYADASRVTALSFEVASYTATTGAIEIWVKIPSLLTATDTVFYMFYGDAAVSTYQGGAVGDAWSSTFGGVWHMANGASLSLLESTSNGSTLTTFGTPTANTGQVDGAVALNGSQYLKTAATSNVTPAVMTLTAWVYPADLSNPGTIFSREESGAQGWGLYTYSTAGAAGIFWINPPAFGGASNQGTTATIPLNTWSHVALVANASGVSFWVNGVADNQNGGNPFNQNASSAIQLKIGTLTTAGAGGTFTTNGRIDEARVANVSRAGSWITTEYNNQSSPSTFYSIGSQGIPVGGTARHHRVIVQR